MHIPYGSTGQELTHDLTGAEILESAIGQLKSEDTEINLVRKAMASPIGGVKLGDLAKGKKNAVIIISDHTRPVPSKAILPPMLAEMRQASPGIDITLLVATGFHRPTNKGELVNKLGAAIANSEKIVIHDSQNPDDNVDIGVLPSGARLVIDKVAVETELLISEGFIEPHFFAGFSGGRKSVMPGICDRVTVLGNHCSAFIASPNARTGILEDNPLHKDMVAAAKIARLQYIVNVVIDEDKRVAAAFAGDPFLAHEAGCAFIKQYCRVKPIKKGDIVVTSNGGAPLDQNVYQSVKGLTAAEAAAAEGAVLIISTLCNDGTGGESFFQALKNCESAKALEESVLKVPQDKTDPDQWEYQILVRILSRHRIIFVCDPALAETIRQMKMEFAPTVDAALDMAYAEKGPTAHLVVIPNGISVIVDP